MRTYFITGATGAIGSALVPILMQDPENNIQLLLRAASAEELVKRQEDLFSFWQVGTSDRNTRSRIKVLRGDVTAPRFGLDDNAFAALCAVCTHIVHSAGNVRMNLPIELARRSSIESVRQIVALARDCPRLKKVEVVSTVGVAGRTRGTVPETWISSPRRFHNTYEQAKAEAEEVVRQEIDRGLPITVHRPSMVVGDTARGRIIHFQVFYHLCEFLSGQRTLGLSPDFGTAKLDIVPADYVAQVIAWSSTTPDCIGHIMHICSGPDSALPLTRLRDDVRRAFSEHGRRLPRIVTLPTRAFRNLLMAVAWLMPASTRRAIKTLPVFLDYLATDQTFGNRNTQSLLSGVGLALPAPATYLDKVFDYYLQHSRAN